jgi:hypothetical protein
MDAEGGVIFMIFLWIATIVLVIVCYNQCGIYPSAMKRCEELCKNSQGVEKIYYDEDCRCKDSAFYATESWTIE